MITTRGDRFVSLPGAKVIVVFPEIAPLLEDRGAFEPRQSGGEYTQRLASAVQVHGGNLCPMRRRLPAPVVEQLRHMQLESESSRRREAPAALEFLICELRKTESVATVCAIVCYCRGTYRPFFRSAIWPA